ncbi:MULTISPECIES: helix-turn-helix domain-containing protein [Chryseobacterium]|uniref:AraC family transcriptional activator of pobA n=1 Tax=Chryseobacterium camelliae TaxID=1265445 RepID=A0ABU0TFR5_9FLAO|nr:MULTISPECIES: helix-turn-helix domain-containing protein [Chryseobacterium]MDT3406301.1 AraC family transcriptional activator of pobA [Pseudacidovorax intermedius]MDQ1095899.1 AraC family transcriptional activator of pobA [Chryseobacterium camelliae]MDQ1099837.1 AraC family transcriptional activator of pobA [Chryseobacterium sp. SORGH_AS_1048]MDR6087182.1 AraC family transcriptional activator of pobA [Chryseobacterium sp. SORGH_AS_0909]MDR6131556.1 AraC family transcriptional activator of p
MKGKVKRIVSEFNSELKLQGFKAFQIEEEDADIRVYSRKEFYKICLTTGRSKIHYSDKSFEQEGTILFFGNPHIPYSWESISRSYVGYAILFSEEFFKNSERSESLQQSSFFKIGGTPVLKITTEQREFLIKIFQKMIAEQESGYVYKDELIRNYISLIIHESLKLEPSENYEKNKNASLRLTSVFIELLERQFPIETVNTPLKLKNAQHYARHLHVHVNSLNRAVKETTGKSTTAHITERIVTEAKALLLHTDWSISEIAYSLGYEYPTYFNNFFKKQTGTNPKTFRLGDV